MLHVFNPVRLDYIREQATARLGRDPLQRRPFEGLRILDIGCGGGLLCEPMARLGATVVGVDPSEKNIKTASVHAQEMGLSIDYRVGLAEDLAAADERFDVILNMEVIEHVADPAAYTRACLSMLKPGGLMFVATINRTGKSFALAIVGAEYVLGWLPKGTHQWEKFITPAELKGWLTGNGGDVEGRKRRHLSSPCRRLASLARHGRQLHDGGAEGRFLNQLRVTGLERKRATVSRSARRMASGGRPLAINCRFSEPSAPMSLKAESSAPARWAESRKFSSLRTRRSRGSGSSGKHHSRP